MGGGGGLFDEACKQRNETRKLRFVLFFSFLFCLGSNGAEGGKSAAARF